MLNIMPRNIIWTSLCKLNLRMEWKEKQLNKTSGEILMPRIYIVFQLHYIPRKQECFNIIKL